MRSSADADCWRCSSDMSSESLEEEEEEEEEDEEELADCETTDSSTSTLGLGALSTMYAALAAWARINSSSC